MVVAGMLGVAFALVATGVSLLALLAVSLGGMSDNCRDSNEGMCSSSTQLADFVTVSSIAIGSAIGCTALAMWLVLGRSRRGVGRLRLFAASAALIVCTVGVALVGIHSPHLPIVIGAGMLALLGWARATAWTFDRKLKQTSALNSP
jgi:hypothetical protein